LFREAAACTTLQEAATDPAAAKEPFKNARLEIFDLIFFSPLPTKILL
jgi:hypothetical protein